MNRTGRLIIIGLLLLGACAPKVEDRAFGPAKTNFGPRTSDTDLSQKLNPSSVKTNLNWQGTIPTSIFFQQADNLVVLGKSSDRASVSKLGISWIQKFYSDTNTTSNSELGDSPFAAIAATATEDEVQKTLGEVHADLENSRRVLKSKILELGQSYPWPQKSMKLNAVLKQAGGFVNMVVSSIGSMPISKAIAEGVQAELKKSTDELFGEMQNVVVKLYAAKDFTKALETVDDLIKKMNIDLAADAKKNLDQGGLLSKDLESMKDAQSGLTILIDIWKMLTPDERLSYVKAENEALYDFLNAQDEKSLNCLRLPGCSSGIFQGVKKLLFILPRIDQYGVDTLKVKLNEKMLVRLVEEVEAQAFEFLKTLPQTIVDQIDVGLVTKNKELQGIQKNYPTYLKGLLNKWAERSFPGSRGKVKGFEVPAISLKLSVQNKLTITPAGDSLDLKATTVGSSMTAAANLLSANVQTKESRTQLALAQVNKLIAIGGYRDDEKKLVPALFSPVEKTKSMLDLVNFSRSAISYRIPDSAQLSTPFGVSNDVVYAKDFSAAAFAEQIKGLSHMLHVTADWKKSAFDETLGNVRAQELTQDINSPALNRPLFPKETIFALNLGDVAVLLKNITKHATPVFLITLDNKTVWADQYVSGGKESPIMAGLVDIKDGKRSNVVQLKDVANFLISLGEFLQATEGFENAKSPLLRELGDEQKTPIESLKEGRRDIKLLIVALANFISNQMMDERGLVQGAYYLNQLQRSNDPNFSVDNQVYAIRALISAWEITHIDAYMNSAFEIYFALNKNAFSVEEGFYVNGDGSSLSFPQKVHALRGLGELKMHLPVTSQAQLVKISAPWLKALEELQ